MPDITMCKGKDCPLAGKCYRCIAEPNPYWQSFFMNEPYNKETKTCEHYWEREVKK